MSAQVQIRDAQRADVELIFSWIVELAEYERAPEQVDGDPALLESALFGPRLHEWQIHRLDGAELALVADGAR